MRKKNEKMKNEREREGNQKKEKKDKSTNGGRMIYINANNIKARFTEEGFLTTAKKK